jgi:hypothetical protein
MFRQDKRLRNRKDMPNQSFAMETIGWFRPGDTGS